MCIILFYYVIQYLLFRFSSIYDSSTVHISFFNLNYILFFKKISRIYLKNFRWFFYIFKMVIIFFLFEYQSYKHTGCPKNDQQFDKSVKGITKGNRNVQFVAFCLGNQGIDLHKFWKLGLNLTNRLRCYSVPLFCSFIIWTAV